MLTWKQKFSHNILTPLFNIDDAKAVLLNAAVRTMKDKYGGVWAAEDYQVKETMIPATPEGLLSWVYPKDEPSLLWMRMYIRTDGFPTKMSSWKASLITNQTIHNIYGKNSFGLAGLHSYDRLSMLKALEVEDTMKPLITTWLQTVFLQRLRDDNKAKSHVA